MALSAKWVGLLPQQVPQKGGPSLLDSFMNKASDYGDEINNLMSDVSTKDWNPSKTRLFGGLVPKQFNRDVSYGVGGIKIEDPNALPHKINKDVYYSRYDPVKRTVSYPQMSPLIYPTKMLNGRPEYGNDSVLAHELAHAAWERKSLEERKAFVNQFEGLETMRKTGSPSLNYPLKSQNKSGRLEWFSRFSKSNPAFGYYGDDSREANFLTFLPKLLGGTSTVDDENYAMLAGTYADEPKKNPFKSFYTDVFSK